MTTVNPGMDELGEGSLARELVGGAAAVDSSARGGGGGRASGES